MRPDLSDSPCHPFARQFGTVATPQHRRDAHLVEVELRYPCPDPRCIYVSPSDVVTQVAAAVAVVSPLQHKLNRGESVVEPGWRLPGRRRLRQEFPHLDGMEADSRPKASGCNRTWVAGVE